MQHGLKLMQLRETGVKAMGGQVQPGAEAWSHKGTLTSGVLVIHGFTGNPSSVRELAERLPRRAMLVSLDLIRALVALAHEANRPSGWCATAMLAMKPTTASAATKQSALAPRVGARLSASVPSTM